MEISRVIQRAMAVSIKYCASAVCEEFRAYHPAFVSRELFPSLFSCFAQIINRNMLAGRAAKEAIVNEHKLQDILVLPYYRVQMSHLATGCTASEAIT
jgi:hypothetical protein